MIGKKPLPKRNLGRSQPNHEQKKNITLVDFICSAFNQACSSIADPVLYFISTLAYSFSAGDREIASLQLELAFLACTYIPFSSFIHPCFQLHLAFKLAALAAEEEEMVLNLDLPTPFFFLLLPIRPNSAFLTIFSIVIPPRTFLSKSQKCGCSVISKLTNRQTEH